MVFKISLDSVKKDVLSKSNTYKGLYGVIDTRNGKRLFKFIGAREYKKEQGKMSFSLLVQNGKDSFNERDWKMVRLYKNMEGEVELATYPYAVLEII